MKKLTELSLGIIFIILLIIHVFGLLDQSMMISGALVLFACVYLGLLWSEKVNDERDEYIRSKVDRYLYIGAILGIIIDIVYKTGMHMSYLDLLIILSILTVGKLVLSKVIKDKN